MNENPQNSVETEFQLQIGIGPILECNASTPSCFQIICFQIEKFREIAVCNVENVNKKYNVRLKIWLLKILSTYFDTQLVNTYIWIHCKCLQLFTRKPCNLYGENL